MDLFGGQIFVEVIAFFQKNEKEKDAAIKARIRQIVAEEHQTFPNPMSRAEIGGQQKENSKTNQKGKVTT